jgi:hypothetical protein
MGEPDGTDGIIACLRTNDPDLQVKTLVALTILPLRPLDENTPSWWESPVPLRQEALFAALVPLLQDPASQVGGIALEAATKLDVPQADIQLMPLIQHPSRKVRTKVLYWLAQRGEDRGAFRAAEALLFALPHSPHDDYWVLQALSIYCEGDNPDLARCAADLLVRYIHANVDRSDNYTTNHVCTAMSGIEAMQHPEEMQALESVIQSSLKDWGRGVALARLGELEGRAGILRLQRALTDPKLREYAAKGIAKAARGHTSAALVETLVAALRKETREQVLGALIDALIAVGADVASILDQVPKQLEPYAAMRVFWLTKRLVPRIAAEKLVRSGATPSPSEELLTQLDERWQTDRQPSDVVLSLLHASNRLTGFDCEASTVPVDYVDLIDRLIEISRDTFEVEAISQQPPTNATDYEIQFVHGDKVYHFKARDLGDWYDVGPVIQTLNRALCDAGRAERFVLLYSGGQGCLVTFVPEPAFRHVARELCLPLEDDYLAAVNRGMAYEQHVRDSLAAEESEPQGLC